MFEISDMAGAMLKATLSCTGDPSLWCVRVSAGQSNPMTNGSRILRLDLVRDVYADDEVLEAPGGAHVVVDRQLLTLLDGKMLDVDIDSDGNSSLFLAQAS